MKISPVRRWKTKSWSRRSLFPIVYKIIHCFIISKVCPLFSFYFIFLFAKEAFWKVSQVQWLSHSRHVAVCKRTVSSASSLQAWQQRRQQLPTQPSQRPWRSRRSSWRQWAATTATPTTTGSTERMETSAPVSVRMPFIHAHTVTNTSRISGKKMQAAHKHMRRPAHLPPFQHTLKELITVPRLHNYLFKKLDRKCPERQGIIHISILGRIKRESTH